VKHGTAGFPSGVEPKIPFFGGPFLTQVYLVVDYENEVFSLAHTKRDTSSSGGLRKLACDEVTTTFTDDESPGKNNIGAIVGGSVGGAVALIALAGLLFYFLVYRKRKQQPAAAAPPPPFAPSAVDPGQSSGEKKGDIPRYTSPVAPYGAYPPPPPESVASGGSPYPTYNSSHYSGANTWSTSPPLPAQDPETGERGFMLASTRLDPVELGPGQRESMITPIAQQSPVEYPPYSPDPHTADDGRNREHEQQSSLV
jgi:hypothetical protein